MWYLNEVLIGLAFFDCKVPETMKTAMVTALKYKGSDETPWRVKPDVSTVSGQQLSDFVTSNTLKFFVSLSIPHDWRKLHPSS